jgi:hypothetical protein
MRTVPREPIGAQLEQAWETLSFAMRRRPGVRLRVICALHSHRRGPHTGEQRKATWAQGTAFGVLVLSTAGKRSCMDGSGFSLPVMRSTVSA